MIEVLFALFVGLICGIVIGQFGMWSRLGIPITASRKEFDEWIEYLKEGVEDRKADLRKHQYWFD